MKRFGTVEFFLEFGRDFLAVVPRRSLDTFSREAWVWRRFSASDLEIRRA